MRLIANKEVIEAMDKLTTYGPWKVVKVWLEVQSVMLAKNSCAQTAEQMYRMQGSSQLIDELLAYIESSPTKVSNKQDGAPASPLAC